MQTTDLPARPDIYSAPPAPPAPKKSRKLWIILGVIVAIVALVVGLGLVATGGEDQATAPEVIAPLEPVETAACLDTTQGAVLAGEASSHFDDGYRAMQNFDTSLAADELDLAATSWGDIGDLYIGVPGGETYSALGVEIEGLLHDGATDIRAFRLPAATANLEASMPLMDEMTAGLPSFSGEVC